MSGQKIEETLEDLHEFHDATTGMWTSDWVLQVCVVLSVLAERVGGGRDVFGFAGGGQVMWCRT